MNAKSPEELEAARSYLAALYCYTAKIKDDSLSQSELLNFMVLSFEMHDYGFLHSNQLGVSVVETAGSALEACLRFGNAHFKDEACFAFWSRYINEMLMPSRQLSEEECQAFVDAGCLDAAFCSRRDASKIAALRLAYRSQKTARAEYIMSMIQDI